MKKAIKSVIGIVIIVTMLMSMVIVANAGNSSLTTAATDRSDAKTLTSADYLWKFIPTGNGEHYLQNSSGKYLGLDGNLNFVDTPTAWRHTVSNNIFKFDSPGNRDGDGLHIGGTGPSWRWSFNADKKDIELFKKEVTSSGEVRYVGVTKIEDNESYIIVGKHTDGTLCALAGSKDRGSGGDVRIDATVVDVNVEGSIRYITYGEKEDVASTTPSTPEATTPAATTPTATTPSTTTPTSSSTSTGSSGKESGNPGTGDALTTGLILATLSAAGIFLIKKHK